ncbi:ATP-binding cassette domain-containing protein [Mucilaginibacter sp. P25]|uniref:ATP-binding cassette domain-containing protein n=1 Tax=Mucilaginibacter sp. P25 TaxID=3423945 RepID=UPI003D7A9FB4
MGPVSTLVNIFPFFTRVQISTARIDDFQLQLERDQSSKSEVRSDSFKFSSIRFENIVYKYDEIQDQGFSVEIKDLRINANEVIFLTGGNGSGKTTFINILTGLYRPKSGKVFINDEEIPFEQINWFREQVDAVFSDHHLFKHNYDEFDLTDNNALLEFFKDAINVRALLRIDSAKNHYDTKLSRGQQKRVALLLALLSDRQIIVLDEWAAEQDPFNRNSFYSRWLRLIKDLGKTIIVISHDDDSFDHADRLIKFSDGKVISDLMVNVDTAQN